MSTVRGISCVGSTRALGTSVVAPSPKVFRVRRSNFLCRSHPHGSSHGAVATKGSDDGKTGFIAEMRTVAMKLHTPKQAPGEGEKPERNAEERPVAQWTPTREGYLRFLVESKAVYDTMESLMKEGSCPEYAYFRNTGLERGPALAKDIEWMAETYGLEVPRLKEDGSGAIYSAYLREIAENDPQAFICHWYNQYFAHTAGGLMIGRKMSQELIDGKTLEFYQWDGDVQEFLVAVRKNINKVAETWTREEKDHCLAETELSFKYSGALLREIAT